MIGYFPFSFTDMMGSGLWLWISIWTILALVYSLIALRKGYQFLPFFIASLLTGPLWMFFRVLKLKREQPIS